MTSSHAPFPRTEADLEAEIMTDQFTDTNFRELGSPDVTAWQSRNHFSRRFEPRDPITFDPNSLHVSSDRYLLLDSSSRLGLGKVMLDGVVDKLLGMDQERQKPAAFPIRSKREAKAIRAAHRNSPYQGPPWL